MNIKINTKFTVEIFDYSNDGEGVARLDNGCIVFVEDAVRSDICDIVITKARTRLCHAKIVKLVKSSEHRIRVDCSVFDRCGGCDYRHISYEEELFAKRKKVNDALRRIGGVGVEIEDILTTGKMNGYRNNIQLKSDGSKIGFYSSKTHDIVEIDKCLLVPEDMNRTIKHMQESGRAEQGTTLARVLHIKSDIETIGDLTFQRSGNAFFQVNTEVARLLYDKAREYADLQLHECLLDLYCGTGTIALYLGRDAKRVIGVEINAHAIDDAKVNAANNNINNAEFVCGDVSKLDVSNLTPDCITVDPPRKGLTCELIQKITELSPSRIVYISCAPATLARDINLLNGYQVKRACAVDMFPRTKHVEVVVLLSKIE